MLFWGNVSEEMSLGKRFLGKYRITLLLTYMILKKTLKPESRSFQVGIASKYFGPIILSMNSMMKDVLLFLITFVVIMVAFSCGVSFIFNMASGKILIVSLKRSVYTAVTFNGMITLDEIGN
jgi:hypothetical protein